MVHTLHGPWTEPSRKLYGLLADYVHLVAISDAQRADNPDIRYAGVVHNGVNLDDYRLIADKDDFLVYIGRANPDKGPTLAIEVARRAGLPLAMVVKKNEPFERAYWDEIVAPLLHDEVEVYEAISHERKADLLGRARAMVFPIQWPEPFGLVMVEAMACGTPVVACPAGAAVELVDEGVTGFLRESIDGLVEAVAEVGRCSPVACRQRVSDHFSADAMVDAYERIYEACDSSLAYGRDGEHADAATSERSELGTQCGGEGSEATRDARQERTPAARYPAPQRATSKQGFPLSDVVLIQWRPWPANRCSRSTTSTSPSTTTRSCAGSPSRCRKASCTP